MKSWCLCQICTCGRHHCPHGTTRIYENSGISCPTTEYLEKYPTYGHVLPPQSLKPKQEFRACRGKMEGITTFKSDYRPYEIVKQPRHVPEEHKPKQGEIDLDTTYKRDFNSYKVQPVAIVRPLERQQAKQGKVDAVPTYKGVTDDQHPTGCVSPSRPPPSRPPNPPRTVVLIESVSEAEVRT